MNNLKKNIKKFSKSFSPLLIPYALVMFFLIIVPIIFICLYAIIAPTNNSLSFTVNLHKFVEFFSNKSFVVALFVSIGYAWIASLIALLIGYPVAYIMAFMKSKWALKNTWILITLPIWISMILKIIGLQILFNIVSPQLLGTPVSVIIGMVYAFLPFMILPIFNSLEKINKSYLQASKDLGASWWTMFHTIILRKSLPGILTGSVFVIIQSSTSLIIVHYLGLSNVNLIVSVAQSYFFNSGDFSYGSVIALILMFFIIILLIINKLIFKFIIKDKKNKNKGSMSNEKIF